MAVGGLGTTSLRVIANTTVFEQTLKRSIKRMSALTGAIFAGAAVGNFLGSAVKNSMNLESSVARIQTLLGDAGKEWQQYFSADTVRNLSNEIGLDATKTAESIYYMIGSGVELTKVLGAVKDASNVAIATNSDLKFSADFVSTALNAYEGSVDKLTGKLVTSEHATDIFFSALKEGKGEPRDLAQYISTAITAADGLNVSFSEVASAMATGTLTGTKARKVATGLSYIMRGLGNDTKGVGEVFKNLTKVPFAEWIKKEGNTLQGAIKILGSKVGQQQIANVGGAETGLNAIQQLLQLWPQYEKIQKNVAKASGDAEEAINIVNDTTARQLEFLKTRFKNFSSQVGDWITPFITRAVVGIDNLRMKFNAAWPEIRAKISEFVSWVQPIFVGIFDFIRNIDWAGIASLIGTALSTIGVMLSPIILAIQGVAAMLNPFLVEIINGVIGFLQSYSGIIMGVVGALTAYKIATMVAAGWTATYGGLVAALGNIKIWYKTQVALLNVQVLGYAVANGVAATSVGILTRAQLLLNAAFRANPLGFIITVLSVLATAFMIAWQKSETFRNIVVKAFNTMKDIAIYAIQGLVRYLMEVYVKKPLQGFLLLAEAVGHLPKWLGGGMGDAAAGAIRSVLSGVDSMIGKVNELAEAARAADWVLNESTGDKGPKMPEVPKMPPMPKMPEMPKMPDFSGGGYVDPKAAEDKAKEAAKLIKQALGRVKADLKRIAKNIGEQTIDKIRENFKQLYADLKDAKAPKALIDGVKKTEARLIKLAKARDKVDEKLDKAKAKLKKLKDAYSDFYKSVRDGILDLANVTSTGYQTSEGIIWRMRRVLETAQRFQKAIFALQKTNLDKDVLRDIIEAGPVAGINAAEALLAGGQAAINEVNTIQKDIEKIAKDTAKVTADGFYAAGIKAAEGLVAGLQSQHDKLVEVMEGLADVLVNVVKKKLKIKSPSQVMADEVGAMMAAGIVQGVTGANVDSIGSAVGDTALTGLEGSPAAGGGAPSIHVYIGDQELTQIVRVEMRQQNRAFVNRAKAGSASGTIRH